MRTTLVLALLAAAALPQSPYPREDDPSPDRVKEATDALTAAFKGKDPAAQEAAIRAHGGVNADPVVHALAKGLRERNESVKTAAIDALGWHPSREALKQLHRLYRREAKLLAKQPVPYAALFKAIGRHGDKSSLDVLGDNPFKGLTVEVAEARILGIANVRDKRSVEGLLKGMRLWTDDGDGGVGGRRDNTGSRGMRFFRPALCVLTGVDNGMVDEAWHRWWRENKNKFKMSPTRPETAPADVKAYWKAFWGEDY
jgi:hypothetical protein